MILCPLCRGKARPETQRLSYTWYRCVTCDRSYYLPSNLATPLLLIEESAAADSTRSSPIDEEPERIQVEHQQLGLRRRLWRLDDCIAFLLGTRQIGYRERNDYQIWRRAEEDRIDALGEEDGAKPAAAG